MVFKIIYKTNLKIKYFEVCLNFETELIIICVEVNLFLVLFAIIDFDFLLMIFLKLGLVTDNDVTAWLIGFLSSVATFLSNFKHTRLPNSPNFKQRSLLLQGFNMHGSTSKHKGPFQVIKMGINFSFFYIILKSLLDLYNQFDICI